MFPPNMPWVIPGYKPPCSFCKKTDPEHTPTCRYYKPPDPPASKCECPAKKFNDGCHESWCPDWKPYAP